jgi:hypothetical protein
MEFNQFLFPAPRSSYTSQTYLGDLIYIPKYETSADGSIKQFTSSDFPTEVPIDIVPNKPNEAIKNNNINNHMNMALLKAQRKLKLKGNNTEERKGEFIPCLYLPYVSGSSKLVIYFHGNAEDIGLATELLNYVKEMLKVQILSVKLNVGPRSCNGVPWLRHLQWRIIR